MKKFLMSLMIMLAFCGSIFAQIDQEEYYPTHWDFNPGLYEQIDYPVAYLIMNGTQVALEDNWQRFEVASFINGTIRGHYFMTDEYNAYDMGWDWPLYQGIPVNYNPTESGADVSFKIYDHVAEVEYECTTNYTIHAGEEHVEIFMMEGEYLYISFETGATGITKEIDPYTDNSGWYLISSPVGEVDPTAVTNMTTGEYDLYAFDQVGDDEGKQWINYEPAPFILQPGQGYLYANENGDDIVFPGTAYAGTGTFELAYQASATYLVGINVMGNPFDEAATVDRAFYTLNPADNTYVEHVAGEEVPAMEGIIVAAETTGENVTFTKGTGEKSANATLNLTQSGKLVDRAIMTFEGRNLPKMQFNPNNTKIYMPVNGKDYAVATVESFGEMPVNFKAESNGTFTLNFTSDNVSFDYLHLIDNMTGDEVDLLVNPAYTFSATTSDYESRFKLVFATGNASNSDFAYVSNDNLIVNGEGLLKVIDMTGRVIATEQISGVSSIKLNAAAGVYVLQLNDKTQKIVVR